MERNERGRPSVLRSDRARAAIAGSRSAWLDLVNQRSDVAVPEAMRLHPATHGDA